MYYLILTYITYSKNQDERYEILLNQKDEEIIFLQERVEMLDKENKIITEKLIKNARDSDSYLKDK